MASPGTTRRIVNLVAGGVCLATAGLNAWNMASVGVTPLRVLLAGTIGLIGVYLLGIGFRTGRGDTSV